MTTKQQERNKEMTSKLVNQITSICDRTYEIVMINHLWHIDRFQQAIVLMSMHQSMDLDRLLKFDDVNFMHDINGMLRYFDCDTATFRQCWSPRCSKAEVTK